MAIPTSTAGLQAQTTSVPAGGEQQSDAPSSRTAEFVVLGLGGALVVFFAGASAVLGARRMSKRAVSSTGRAWDS